MTPLDDQLRRTLSERASVLAPSADPLAGVEARASRIRRRRMAGAVAGAAAAVAAVALAVPSLVTDDTATKPPQFASPSSTASAEPTASPAPPAPAGPATWEYRGNDIPAATLATFESAWQTRHPGSTLTPLFGQVYEPSATQELFFVAGERVGVVQSAGTSSPGGSGAEFLYDEKSASDDVLAFVLPGDETPRLLAVAAPDTVSLRVTETTDGAQRVMTPLAPGVGVLGLSGPSTSQLRVVVPVTDKDVVLVRPYDNQRVPTNLLTWPLRGTDAVSPSTLDLRTRFAQAFGRSDVDQTSYSPLYVGKTDSGVHYTMGQAWFNGADKAYSVSYATGGTSGPAFFLGKVTPTNPWGLAFLFGDLPGTTTDLLIVVPRPMIGEISYSPDASTPFVAVANGRSDLNGIAFVDRAKDATDDRLEALEGDGIHVLYRGPVAPLLCGLKDCG